MNISQNDTKKRIRDTALKLFSKRGYEGVSVSDIAAGVGIKAPSLYKHYSSKMEIFMSIIEDAEKSFRSFIDTIRLDNTSNPEELTEDLLIERLSAYVSYALHDGEYSALRKLLTIEQYTLPEAAGLYERIYQNALFSYHTAFFTQLISAGAMKGHDPMAMAMMYGAPVIVLISSYDRNEKGEEEVHDALKRHVKQFYEIFSGREE